MPEWTDLYNVLKLSESKVEYLIDEVLRDILVCAAQCHTDCPPHFLPSSIVVEVTKRIAQQLYGSLNGQRGKPLRVDTSFLKHSPHNLFYLGYLEILFNTNSNEIECGNRYVNTKFYLEHGARGCIEEEMPDNLRAVPFLVLERIQRLVTEGILYVVGVAGLELSYSFSIRGLAQFGNVSKASYKHLPIELCDLLVTEPSDHEYGEGLRRRIDSLFIHINMCISEYILNSEEKLAKELIDKAKEIKQLNNTTIGIINHTRDIESFKNSIKQYCSQCCKLFKCTKEELHGILGILENWISIRKNVNPSIHKKSNDINERCKLKLYYHQIVGNLVYWDLFWKKCTNKNA